MQKIPNFYRQQKVEIIRPATMKDDWKDYSIDPNILSEKYIANWQEVNKELV